MFVLVCGFWAAVSECSACKMMTVSAVFTCLKSTVWELWVLLTSKSRGKCWERGSNCTSMCKGRVGKLLEELEGSVEEKTDWLLTVRGGHGGLQMLLLRWFAKENYQTKEYSVECKPHEDAVENRGDHLEFPPNIQCYHLKRLELFEKGWVQGQEKREGNLSTHFLNRRKHLKFLVHRFVFLSFFFQETFAEATFLKCTFYKVYQIFSYLKPNVNRNL